MGSISPALAVEEVGFSEEKGQVAGQEKDRLDSQGERVDVALLPEPEDTSTEPSTGEHGADAKSPLANENGGSSEETPPMEGDCTTEPPTGWEDMMLPTQQPELPTEAPTIQLNLVEENDATSYTEHSATSLNIP